MNMNIIAIYSGGQIPYSFVQKDITLEHGWKFINNAYKI